MLEVLFLKSNNLREEHMISSLKACGCNISQHFLADSETRMERILKERTYHFVFSIDYSPSIALACNESGTKYASCIYNAMALQQDLGNIGFYTNYVFADEYSLYEQMSNAGLETIYFLPITASDDTGIHEQYTRLMYPILFKEGELEIFDTIQCLEAIRRKNGNHHWIPMMIQCFREPGEVKEAYAAEIYRLMEDEKELIFFLRDQLTAYMNRLLKQKNKDIGWEAYTWYKRNITSEMSGIFWEFNCFAVFIEISLEELHNERGRKQSSLLQYESMEEMCQVFLQTVFYLRRIEYDIMSGEEKEIIAYIDGRGLSETALKHIVTKAKIFNKEKVIMELQKLRRQYKDE